VLLSLLALLAGCFAAGLFPQEPLRIFVERRLRAAFGPGARLGALRVVPATLVAEVHDLVLDDEAFRLELARGKVELAAATLAQLVPGGGKAPVLIQALELDSPRLVIRASAGEDDGGDSQDLPAILVERLRLSDGRLTYADPDPVAGVSLSGIEAHGSLGQGRLVAEVREGAWGGAPGLSIGPARAELSISPALAIELVSFTAQAGRSRLEARGPLGKPSAWAPRLDLSATLDLSDLGVLGAPALGGALEASGRLDGPIDSAALALEIHGSGLRLADWPVASARAKLRLQVGGPADASWTLGLAPGRVEGMARLRDAAVESEVRLADVELQYLAHALGVRAHGWSGRTSGTLTVNGELDGAVEISGRAQAQARSPAHEVTATLSVSGPLAVPTRSLDLEWSVEADATAVPAPEGPGPAALRLAGARLQARGAARGALPPRVSAEVAGDLSLASPESATTASLRGSVVNQGGALGGELELLGLGGSLRLSADTRDGIVRRLDVQGEALCLAPLGVNGTARLSLDASGPWRRLDGNARLELAGAAWRGVRLGDVRLDAESRKGDVRATLLAPALQLRGEARLPAEPSPVLSASFQLDGSRVETLASLWPEAPAVTGAVSGRVDVTLPVERPSAAEAVARVEAFRLESSGFAVENPEPFVLRARQHGIAVEGLVLAGPGLRVGLSGSLGTRREDPLDLSLDAGLVLGRLPAVAGWTWAGEVQARVALSGSLERPRAEGAVTARELALEGERLPGLAVPEARIDLDSGAIVVRPLTGRLAGGELTLEGRIPLAALVRLARADEGAAVPSGENVSAALGFRAVELAPFLERVRADRISPLAGRVSGRLDLEGELGSLAELRADLRVEPEAIVAQDLALQVSPLRLRVERGEAVLEPTTVTGEGSQLTLGGRLDLAKQVVNGTAHGEMRLRALSPFLPETALTGRAVLDLGVSGPLAAWSTRGSLSIHEATLRLRALPQALTDLEARVVLDQQSLRIEEGRGLLGGGELKLAGTARLQGKALSDVDLKLSGRDVGLRYPEGLRTRLDLDLTLSGEPGALRLGGLVKAQRGLYDLDLALEESLLAKAVEPEESPLLRSIGLDLRVETVEPVQVRNNLARLEASGSLSLLGDLQSPAPVGRLDLREGGRVFLQQREFVIESGRLAYDGTWDPEISLKADTVLRGVDLGDLEGRQDVEVSVTLEGPLSRPRASFSSDPGGWSEPEIVAMIATGRVRGEALSSGAWVAGEQAALFLTGRLTRGLTSELRELGLDEVTIQPELLAREIDPGARFTFGKHLTESLRLVYSLSLSDSESRFTQLSFEPGWDVNLLGQRRDDGSLTLGGGQRLRFFGPPRPPAYREPKLRLEQVKLEPEGEDPALREMLRVKPGDRVSEWDLQDEAERVRERLRASGHIEAEVTARAEGTTAVFRVDAGPRYIYRVEGMADPPELGATIEDALFEEDALARGRARLLEALHARGHLEARVETRSEASEDRRTLVFGVAPGPRLRVEAVRFPGATALSHGRLLEAAGGASRLLSDPDAARRAIREAYRDRHYLAAEVEPPRVLRSGDELALTVPVAEGPRARVRSLRFIGISPEGSVLARVSGIEAGAPFERERVLAAVDRIRDHYYGLGYPGVRVAPRLEAAQGDLDVVFEVSEGPRQTIGSIEITGARATRESFVRGALGLVVGDPLDPRRLAQAERKLLALGAFARASVTRSGSGEGPVVVRVELVEEARLSAGYQARYNDDKGLSGDLDAELGNLLGRALAIGAHVSRGRDDEEIRGSIQLPALGFLGSLTGSVFRDREERPLDEDEDAGPTLRQLEKGFELQASRPLRKRWNLLYGYRFKTSSVSSELDEFGVSTRIASLDVSLLRDTRDNPLDARRGRFWSLNLEIAPRLLASDLDFMKGMAQLFASRSFGPSLTWAQGYRLGLAHVFGDERLVFSERFKAGGSHSIRGFATDSVGPRDFFGDPAGGEALLVMNQELRYRLPAGLGGVVFWDAGNVFAKASDLSLDLRHALGAGLRWESPVGLLRLDLGFPLDRLPDERAYRLFFSLGQAF